MYICVAKKKKKKAKLELALSALKWHCEPLAWCRLPLVDEQRKIRDGKIKLRLWDVPVWTYVKGGPKVDPHTTGFWKKFGTTTQPKLSDKAKQVFKERDAQRSKELKHSSKKKPSKKERHIKINHSFFSDSTANEIDTEGEDDLYGILLCVEFPSYPFHVVAPIVNARHDPAVAQSIVPFKRRHYPGKDLLEHLIKIDGIEPLSDKDKMLVYSNKEKLMGSPEALPTVLFFFV
ncbi:hypothetical protein RFI_16474, partial [Reticulomyxa filosa]